MHRPCILQYIINFPGSRRNSWRQLDVAQTAYFTIHLARSPGFVFVPVFRSGFVFFFPMSRSGFVFVPVFRSGQRTDAISLNLRTGSLCIQPYIYIHVIYYIYIIYLSTSSNFSYYTPRSYLLKGCPWMIGASSTMLAYRPSSSFPSEPAGLVVGAIVAFFLSTCIPSFSSFCLAACLFLASSLASIFDCFPECFPHASATLRLLA